MWVGAFAFEPVDSPSSVRSPSPRPRTTQLLTYPGLSFNFETTENEAIATLVVKKRVYPYSEDFSFKEFDQATCTVISVGHAATVYSSICLDIESALETHSPDRPVPYIQ